MSLEWIDGRYPVNMLADDRHFQTIFPGRVLKQVPLGFVDVGARGGVHDLVASVAAVTAVLGFEPDERACQDINKAYESSPLPWAALKILPAALAQEHGNATLYLCSAPTNHSLLPVSEVFAKRYRMEKFRQTGHLSLETQTLDSVLFGPLAKEPCWGEFIKLDTQGSEFEILKGADRTLRERTVALFVEVEFCQIYEGQKLFSDVEALLREYGFSFYGFHSTHERSRKLLDKKRFLGRERLLHADAVFFKDPLPCSSRYLHLSDRQVAVLFTCAVILGYFDFALELASETFASSGEEKERVAHLIHSFSLHTPNASADAIRLLSEQVQAQPELANIHLGRFIDKHRAMCNFEDATDK